MVVELPNVQRVGTKIFKILSASYIHSLKLKKKQHGMLGN